MNIRDLEYIVAVANLGHFGQAAKACHVSQPTLSGQIRKLEDELGITLFERGRGGVKVTDTGQDVIAKARDVLAAADDIHNIARAAQDPYAGTFRMGLIPTVAPYIIPQFVAKLRSELPDLKMVYREDITERLTDDLLDGRIDGALLATPPTSDALDTLPLYTEPFLLVAPKDRDLSLSPPVRMSDVADKDILLLNEGHCFRDQALSVCQTSGTSGQGLRATSLETLINLVAQGQGLTLVPILAMPPAPEARGLQVLPLSDKGAFRRINLTVRKSFSRRRVADRIAATIRDNLPDAVTLDQI